MFYVYLNKLYISVPAACNFVTYESRQICQIQKDYFKGCNTNIKKAFILVLLI